MTPVVPSRPDSRLPALAAGLLVLFLGINLLTIARFPIVWGDEVMFTEPAANLAFHGRFISRVWFFDYEGDLWAGNAPLYSLLLAGWLKLFGLSITAVRAFGLVQTTTGVVALTWALRRTALLRGTWPTIAYAAVLLLSYGISINYRSGRYDGTGIMLCGLAALFATIRAPMARAAALFATGLLIVPAGVHLAVFAGLAGVVALIVFGWRSLRATLPFGLGVAAGGGLFALILWRLGALGHFLHSAAELRHLLGAITPRDPSFYLLALAAAVAAIGLRHDGPGRSWPRYAVALAAATFAAFILLGHFPNYYTWMAVAPLTWLAIAPFDRPRVDRGDRRPARLAVTGLLVLAALAGLPLQLASALLFDRDYAPVERYVAAHVGAEDVAMVDPSAWYAVWPIAAKTYSIEYDKSLTLMTQPERDRVSVLVIRPDQLIYAVRRLGPRWRQVACLCAAPPFPRFAHGRGGKLMQGYELAVYRRAP